MDMDIMDTFHWEFNLEIIMYEITYNWQTVGLTKSWQHFESKQIPDFKTWSQKMEKTEELVGKLNKPSIIRKLMMSLWVPMRYRAQLGSFLSLSEDISTSGQIS